MEFVDDVADALSALSSENKALSDKVDSLLGTKKTVVVPAVSSRLVKKEEVKPSLVKEEKDVKKTKSIVINSNTSK